MTELSLIRQGRGGGGGGPSLGISCLKQSQMSTRCLPDVYQMPIRFLPDVYQMFQCWAARSFVGIKRDAQQRLVRSIKSKFANFELALRRVYRGPNYNSTMENAFSLQVAFCKKLPGKKAWTAHTEHLTEKIDC